MSDGRIDIPNVNSPNFDEKVREALSVYLGNRGNPLDRGVTLRDLYDAGIISLTDGYLTNPSYTVPIAGVGSAVASAGSGGTTYVADLTAPPTPTGFSVTAGLNMIYVDTDNPAYTTGHGHSKAKLYGVTYTTGALPTFSETYLLDEFTGNNFSFPSDLNKEWHLWLKWVSVDNVASATPAGGVNGLTATTGKIGNTDLNDLIITAGKLATGAVDATKFASSIEPVTLVTSVPSVKSTNSVFNTTNNTLYTWNGTAYATPSGTPGPGSITTTMIANNAITTPLIAANAVTASQIAANTITAGQIASGTITATQIAAGAIGASQIAANSIAVGTAAIQNGAIVNAMIGTATIDYTKIASVDATKITVNTLTGSQIAAGTITGTNIAAGTVTASNIDSRGLSIKDAAGTVIFASGTPLTASYITPASGWLNSNIAISGGAISGIGTGSGTVVDNSLVTATGIGAVQTSLANAPAAILNNNVVAGSGNLYRNTDFGDGNVTNFSNYNNGGTSVTNTVSAGGAVGLANYWRITPNANVGSTWGYFLNGGWAGWQQNTDYVWSFYARAVSGFGSNFYHAWNHAPAVATWISNPGLSTTWQRYVIQINFGSNVVDANGFMSVNGFPLSGQWIDISCIQIETGLQPSGWAPLPYVNSAGNLVGQPGVAAGSAVAVANSNITIAANGTLSGGGGGAVTIVGLGYTGALNATANQSDATTNAGIASAATTATWSGVSSKPANVAALTGAEAILNSAISLGTLGAGSFASLSQITSANVSTYIASAAIGTAQIQNAAITNALIGNAAIGTANIADANITGAKIASATITNANIAAATITAAEIAAATITNAKIASGTILEANIADANISTLKIAGNAVTIPTSAYTAASASIALGPEVLVQSLTYTSTGAPVLVLFSCNLIGPTGTGVTWTATVHIYGAALIATRTLTGTTGQNVSFCAAVSDVPAAGSVSYSAYVAFTASSGTAGGSANARQLYAIETKK